jgi:SAM-dependent methyltransferase
VDDYDASTYGERIADVYDELYEHLYPVEPATVLLTELAQGGRALELGIGTGRIALPLAANGMEIYGLDASPDMVEKLRAKAGGERMPVTIGNFADVGVEGTFSLIYVVYNTFFALFSQPGAASRPKRAFPYRGVRSRSHSIRTRPERGDPASRDEPNRARPFTP